MPHSVQRLRLTSSALWPFVFLALTATICRPAGAAPTSAQSADKAVKQMQAGDLRAAAVTVRQGLEADPGDTLLHNVAAALLLTTGDSVGAQSEWEASLDDVPDDGLAQYGLGLAYLARGDRTHAIDRFVEAERTGDKAYCMLSERYVRILEGAPVSAGLALPDAFTAATQALDGLAAAQRGDHKQAVVSLTGALAALPGDPFGEPPGLIMTMDPARPLRYGSDRLPTGNGLASHRPKREAPYHGIITLSAGDVPSDAGFVLFRIDGAVSSLANTRPFRLVWDTSKFPNGIHRIEIHVCDQQGREISTVTREIRTANADAPVKQTPDTQRAERVRAALWQQMNLHPSRLMLAYTAALSAQAAGDTAAMARLLHQAAAIDPDYKDVRERVAAIDATTADPGFWRGAANDNVVALTFDDGPKPGITEQLLAVLAREQVPGTFFVIGRHATEFPALTRKLAEAGMQIEDHTYTHSNLALLPSGSVERELLRTAASVEAATGKWPHYFRPPGGNLGPDTTKIAARWGLTACMWTVDGEALENGSPDRLIEYVLQHACPGAIILLHNGRMTTVEALPTIIDGLRKRGYSFVTVDQLAARRAAAGQATARNAGG